MGILDHENTLFKPQKFSNKVSQGNSEYLIILNVSPILQHCKQLHSSIACTK